MTQVLIKRELLERCRARLYGLMQADLSTELAALLADHSEQHLEMVEQSVEAEGTREALEAECERLADELARKSVITGDCIARCQRLADERDALAAELAAIKGQEPVCEVSEETFSSDGTSDIITCNLPIGTKLYTLPAAPEGGEV